MGLHGAVGAIVADVPLVCVKQGQGCYQLKDPQGNWTKIDIETLGGHHSTSIITAEGSLWIMGIMGNYPGKKSTEILSFDNYGTFVSQASGPDLPQAAWGMCSFDQRDSKVMNAGGTGTLGTITFI